MKITKWSPGLDIGVESPIIPIWISFSSLQPHFFAPNIFHNLGSLFGQPLKINSADYLGSQPSLAHVLVELDIMQSYPEKVWLSFKNLGYVQQVQMEVFPPFCDFCKSIGHKRGDFHSSSTATKHVSSSKPVIHISHEVVIMDITGEGVLNDSVNLISLGVSPVVLVFSPELPLVSQFINSVSPGRHNLNVMLLDSMVDGSILAILGQHLCVSETRGGNCDVNLHPIMSCVTSVSILCGLVLVEIPCALAEKSDSSISAIKGNSYILNSSEVSARLVVPNISSPEMPTVLVPGSFIKVHINLISPEALFSHMGVYSGESVRLQID
ncbi:hypothetical protein MA16_Dca019392 [Dendrobium catenatum]|uniref:Uncharacterized protein n=1 Tax=Dendrobium catenatum TaxID=906689 RepID=A0A2I0VWT3_9ASPA|nr:hypothetical protein MA16_Dca019392 [Dendrobium catenatum]